MTIGQAEADLLLDRRRDLLDSRSHLACASILSSREVGK
jgi:hypothetical protein